MDQGKRTKESQGEIIKESHKIGGSIKDYILRPL